jgi:hypothetical protein
MEDNDRIVELEEELERAKADGLRAVKDHEQSASLVMRGVDSLALRFLPGENIFEGAIRLLKEKMERSEKLARALRAVDAMPNEVVLLDGTTPAVGQRVVLDLDACRRGGLAHAHNEFVHEITRFDPACVLIECGPTQIHPGHLRLAPEGSEVTCRSCLGWSDYLIRLRLDSEAYRAMQVNAIASAARKLISPEKHDDFDREWCDLLTEAAKKAGLSVQGSRATTLPTGGI